MNTSEPASDDLFAFRFRGGRLCLNFVATIGWRDSPKPIERLPSSADFERWIVEAGIATTSPRISTKMLIEAHKLREAIYRIVNAVLHQKSFDVEDLNTVNHWASFRIESPQLIADGKSLAIKTAAAQRAESVIAEIARDAVSLLGGQQQKRIRRCAREDCTLLFVDESRSGRRRWCSMNACGNRAKTVAYRRRSKFALVKKNSTKPA